MRTLADTNARFAGDDGSPDPLTREALAKVSDHTSYIRALVALCTSRLLMPIVASGDETDHPDPDRHAEMAAVKLVNEEATFLLAFTGLDSMQAWQADARPVPCTLDELCATVKEAGAEQLLIDVAGPTSYVIAGEALELLAQGYAVAEFEGEEFAWVKYADEPPADEPPTDDTASQIAELEATLANMERMIAEAEAEAAAEQVGIEQAGREQAGPKDQEPKVDDAR